MLRRSERNLENIPVGALGLIPITGCEELGEQVNKFLVKWRKESENQHVGDVVFNGYVRDNYIINTKVPRFGSGEAKGIITESVPHRQCKPYVAGRSFSEPEACDRGYRRQEQKDQYHHALPL